MLRISRAAVEEVAAATSPTDLLGLVQQAIRLEFATIPPYLTAMLSLKPGTNRPVWWAIHDVVVDEMLHLLIGCNLLNALGGRPALTDPGFLPAYPGPLPLGIGTDLSVGLEPFSLDLVRDTFMQIEEPERPLTFPGRRARPDEPEFASIGEFYRGLAGAVVGLGDAALVGDPARQVTADRWFPAARLFPMTDAATVARALALVTEEGEGTATSPIDPDGDVAHYYRFAAIRAGRRLVRDDTVEQGFSFSGDPYGFDPAGVWPLTPNQDPAAVPADTEAGRRLRQFRVTFGRLLRALQRVVDGEPGHLDAAMGVMFELKVAGQVLVAMPRPGSAEHVGPVFRPLYGNE